MSIGWALVGTGRHAERSVVPEMKKARGTDLVAVVSRDPARGEAFARQHGFANCYTSLQQALDDPAVEALYDATPDALHASNVIAAAKARKHVLVEKPLAFSLAAGREAVAACANHHVKLGVVFNQRHEAAHQEARRRVLGGEIGEVVLVRVQIALVPAAGASPPRGGNWRADRSMRSGGILMSIGDHAYDTLSYLVGQDIEEVCAFTDAPAERAACMMLRLSRGAVGYAVSTAKTPFAGRPFEIHGTRGSLILENTFAYLSGAGEDRRSRLQWIGENGGGLRQFEPTECFRLEIEQFNRSLEGKDEPMTSAEEGLHSLAVTDALYASVRERRVTRVAEYLAR